MFSVRLHGRDAEANGKLRALHHGRDRLQTAGGHSAARHQCLLLPLLHVQGERTPARLSRTALSTGCFQVGPVLSVSHGMGTPSVGILLHEVIKLMYHARCKDPVFVRIGTCGGIGVEGGTVVITEEAVDGLLRNVHEVVSARAAFSRCSPILTAIFSARNQPILGKLVQRPAKLDKRLVRELKSLSDPTTEPYDTVIGKTMCTNDFYEGISNISELPTVNADMHSPLFLELQAKGDWMAPSATSANKTRWII